MKILNSLLITIACLTSLPARATSYQAIARCEEGQVVIDRVFQDHQANEHFQLVVHGSSFVQSVVSAFVNQGIDSPPTYDNGNTLVLRAECLNGHSVSGNAEVEDRCRENPSEGMGLSASGDARFSSHTTTFGDGARYVYVNYVFHGCKQE